MVIGIRVLAHITRRNVVCDEFSHSREVEPALDHTECAVYPPMTCDDWVVVGRDDFLGAVLRYHDFVVSPQSSVLEVLTFVVLKFTGGGVKKYVKTSWSCQ